MEESKITLDNSVKLYDEAGILIKELKEELLDAEKKVKVFVAEKDGEAVIKNFERLKHGYKERIKRKTIICWRYIK